MAQWQLRTLDHLMRSGYGRPFPRHGLPLLFWFANHCVTCEPVNFVLVMKLVSDCQPEKGSYGFHWFGNAEQLLPVMKRLRRSNSKKQPVYFEVGNLNTETYPGSADLPPLVREHYGAVGNGSVCNIDRIIISFQVKTRVVEAVYVTEHDKTVSGRFSPESTYQISAELIQALQSPLLDIATFLTQMGYYAHVIYTYQSHNGDELEPSTQQMLQIYSGSTARAAQNYDFQQQLDTNMSPFTYDQGARYSVQYDDKLLSVYEEWRDIFRTARYPPCGWYEPHEGFGVEAKKGKGGGGFSFIKLLLGAGALYLAVRCFSWLRNWWNVSSDEHVLKMILGRSPSYKHTHAMLDYVY